MTKQKSFLEQALFDNQFDVSPATIAQFIVYLNLLEQWNQIHNLTAIENPRDRVLLHIIDSLTIHRFLHGTRIIDVGTGAGLPGIPLALVNPEKEFVLIDSNNKKILFLNQVILELKIKNVMAVHSRVEDFHPDTCFDSAITRAFSSLKEMLQKTAHLICSEGQFLAMKGAYPEEEIQQVPDNFRVMSIHALRINGMNAERHLVCLEKLREQGE